MTLLCASPTCAIPGRHGDDCRDGCRGCLRGRAADGLRLCWHHVRRLERDPGEAAALHTELGLALIAAGVGDGIRAGRDGTGIKLNDKVADARSTIRHTLVSWARLIGEERGIGLPVDHIAAIGAFVGTHGQWLAAHEAAGEASDEMAALVALGRSLRQPSGTRVVEIGPCPQEGCAGTLRALLRAQESLLPSAVACDADDGHRWDSTQWIKLGKAMKVRVG